LSLGCQGLIALTIQSKQSRVSNPEWAMWIN
jgi:hypothetical protein